MILMKEEEGPLDFDEEFSEEAENDDDDENEEDEE